MDGEPQQEVLLDTSVLINFAVIDRIDLLASLSGYRFVITDHVRDEVQEHFAEQYDALNRGIADGTLEERTVNSAQELADFADLVSHGNLGEGECSAIACAKHHGIPLAIDDKTARKKAVKHHASIKLLDTVELVLLLIGASVLTVAQADDIKRVWEEQHRFRLKFGSFAELLAE